MNGSMYFVLGLMISAATGFGVSADARASEPLLLAQADQTAQGQPPPPTPQQRVANLKAWLKASQIQLRNYEWVETTVVAKDGEEKSRKLNTCYYGADGKLQKVPLPGGSEAKSKEPPGVLMPGRLLKKAAEKKKADLTEYMESVEALVHSYVPPDPERIQHAVDAGAVSVNMVVPGRHIQIVFHNYLKANDALSIDIELPTNRILGMHVASYVDEPDDAVKLDVTMGVLADGTIFTEKVLLDAVSKEVTVTLENSGHRRTGG